MMIDALLFRISFSKIIKPNYARSINTSATLMKNKNRLKQPHLATGKSFKNVNSAAMQKEYIKERELAEAVKGKLPPNPDFYFSDMYEKEKISLQEAILRHREFAMPEMLDSENNQVFAHFILNMRLPKKTKFLQSVVSQSVPPFPLDYLPPKSVIAFCKEPEEIEAALKEGALDAGAVPLITKLEHGQYHWESFDFVVSTPDVLPLLKSLRHILRDKMPHSKNDRVHSNISEAVRSFRIGVEIASVKIDGIPEIATVQLPLGQLSWNIDNLEANLKFYSETIVSQMTKVVGFPFEAISIRCPPSDEHFLLNLDFVQLPKKSHAKSKSSVDFEEENVVEESMEANV